MEEGEEAEALDAEGLSGWRGIGEKCSRRIAFSILRLGKDNLKIILEWSYQMPIRILYTYIHLLHFLQFVWNNHVLGTTNISAPNAMFGHSTPYNLHLLVSSRSSTLVSIDSFSIFFSYSSRLPTKTLKQLGNNPFLFFMKGTNNSKLHYPGFTSV